MDHDYKINDKVLIYRFGIFRKVDGPFIGPFKVIKVYTHGIVHIFSVESLLNVSISVDLPRTRLLINFVKDSFKRPNFHGAITGTYSIKAFIYKCYPMYKAH